jgi:hypothetical protein
LKKKKEKNSRHGKSKEKKDEKRRENVKVQQQIEVARPHSSTKKVYSINIVFRVTGVSHPDSTQS